MAIYMSEVWEELSGAQMVVTTVCEMCTVFAVAYWHGKTEVKYATELYGELSDQGAWTVSGFRVLQPNMRKKKIQARLIQEMCECSQEDEE
jgi:hypothetical protein